MRNRHFAASVLPKAPHEIRPLKPEAAGRRLVGAVLVGSLCVLVAAPARADVPDDKSARVREYRERRFEITQPSTSSYEVRMGTGTESVRVGDRILAERAEDQALLDKINAQQRSRTVRQLSWSLGIPLGAYIFVDNFLGNPRPKTKGLESVPPGGTSFYPANDLRSYLLATGGMVLAAYGAGQLAAWVSERFGWRFTSFLTPAEAKQAANSANNRLLDELALALPDVTEASPSAPTETATSSAGAAVALKGEEYSAAYYVTKATETLRNQRGSGYRLYMVYTKDMADKSGKLQRGSWNYLFYNPQTLDSQEVNVPVFGASPTVGAAPDAYKNWRTAPSLTEQWKVDSPKAMAQLSEALLNRGVPWLVDEATLLLYPYYGNFQVPIWVIDQGTAPLPIGVDAAAGITVDLVQSGTNTLPSAGGVNPPVPTPPR